MLLFLQLYYRLVSKTVQAFHILPITLLLCMSCQTSGYQYNSRKMNSRTPEIM
jgi:hypothetical protein